jgi:hypothetical protein
LRPITSDVPPRETAVVRRGEQLRDHRSERVAAAAAGHLAKHLYDRIHRRRPVPEPNHIDRLTVRGAEVIDRPIDALERAIAHRVGDHTRAEAHRHGAGLRDQ